MDVSLSRGRGTRVALAVSITLNLILLSVVLWPDADPSDAASPQAEVATAEPSPAVAPSPEETTAESPPKDDEAEAEQAVGAAEEGAESDEEPQVTVATVEGSIPQTMAVAAAPYGDFVSATLSRLLVWDLDVRRDLRAGDKVEVAWTPGSSDKVVIDAARFHSQKFNKTITAYRFQADGDTYPSYWSADGVEVPHRLEQSPLAEYEQITSLLKDRPNHHGMDFKVPVGSEVLATHEGVVTQSNWNWTNNGNCIEIRHGDGVVAKYLHLSENRVEPGDRVDVGDVIALSGNTGHSTGPHLHYQLNRGSKVVDPIDYHGTTRRKLPEGDRAAFEKAVAAYDARLQSGRTLAAKE